MPLESYLPAIDNRRYDDIIAEVRTRLARYTPEWSPVWTDVNDSDPGITLAQVFAWLTEMLIYRLGQVPEQNFIKFLELLGIELRPALPAVTEITFQVLGSFGKSSVVIPPRTQVAAESEDGTGMIVFETERSLVALAAQLASVQVFDGYAYRDVSNENTEASQGFEAFGPSAGEGAALLLGFANDRGFPARVELDLAIWAFEENSGPNAYECGLPQSRVYPSAHILWEYWTGKEWHELSLLKDDTQALTRSGHVFLKTPAKEAMRPAAIGKVSEACYWIRAHVTHSSYERPPRLLAVRTNTVEAVQAETVRDEVLGGSDGRPHQTFRLENAPVLSDSLELEVDEGTGFQMWSPAVDFFGSGPADRHYILNRATGEIRFGDGNHGAIPIGNVDNPGANVVARTYRFGGGKHGNLAAGSLTTMLTSITGIDENGIANLLASHSGRDGESLVEAKMRAPRSLKSKCRAVTAEDFEHLAMEAANVQRAKALPLFHPNFPGMQVPGVVTVVIVPDSDAPNPMPSEGTLQTVCEYLNQRRLLTTELYVVRPTYKKVKIEACMITADNADLGAVKTAVEERLLRYFHPLHGGEDRQGWPFGGDIHFSLVYRQALTVAGVRHIERLIIYVDREEIPECRDVQIPAGVLVYSTGHDVQVTYDFDL